MRSRRFWTYIRRHRRAYLLGYAGAVASIAMAQLAPWVLKVAVDGIRRGAEPAALARWAAALAVLAAAEAGAGYVMRTAILGAAHRIEAELRRDYFAHLQRMPLAFFQQAYTGDLMARAVNDLRAVQRFAGVGMMRSVHTIVMVLASAAFMLSISVPLTLWTMAILPIAPLALILLGREIHRRFDEVQAQFSALSTRAQESFSGIRVIKAFAREDDQSARFRGEAAGVVRTNLRLARIQGALWPAIGLVLGGAAVVVLWRGGDEVIRGRISLGQMVQFSYYLARLSFPMVALGWVANLWQQGRASMNRLDEILTTAPQITDPASPVRLAVVRGEIEYRRVGVTLDGVRVLTDVSLRIPAGRTVAIVGPTGAGKSTLVQLLPRVLDPTEGQVLLDGHDVRQLPLAMLRRAVALVPQETFLFSDTLHANIAYGHDDGHGDVGDRRGDEGARTDGGAVLEAAEIAQLTDDAADLSLGYQTVVGERGVTLSGGQRQRAALARAVIRDPRVLILDDALSSVDSDTERRILNELRRIMATRTCLVIAHRISTIREADEIVVLDRGRIAARGTHEALLAEGGLYADLYERQLLREALEAVEVPDPESPADGAAAHEAAGLDGAAPERAPEGRP